MLFFTRMSSSFCPEKNLVHQEHWTNSQPEFTSVRLKDILLNSKIEVLTWKTLIRFYKFF